jgi:hypothetical protein
MGKQKFSIVSYMWYVPDEAVQNRLPDRHESYEDMRCLNVTPTFPRLYGLEP